MNRSKERNQWTKARKEANEQKQSKKPINRAYERRQAYEV